MVDVALLTRLREKGRPLRLLYVEDESDLRREVGYFLEKIFGTVDYAANGREGLDLFRRHRYDAILTDLQMPLLDGVSMLETMKAESPSLPPVVVMTAHRNENQLREIADLILIKPVEMDALVQVLDRIIDGPVSR